MPFAALSTVIDFRVPLWFASKPELPYFWHFGYKVSSAYYLAVVYFLFNRK